MLNKRSGAWTSSSFFSNCHFIFFSVNDGKNLIQFFLRLKLLFMILFGMFIVYGKVRITQMLNLIVNTFNVDSLEIGSLNMKY